MCLHLFPQLSSMSRPSIHRCVSGATRYRKCIEHDLGRNKELILASSNGFLRRNHFRYSSTSSYTTASPLTFDWRDPLRTNDLLTPEELSIAETAEAYCQERLLPRVLGNHTVLRLAYNIQCLVPIIYLYFLHQAYML